MVLIPTKIIRILAFFRLYPSSMSNSYLISGTIVNGSGSPLEGLTVKAFDIDLLSEDDYLGHGITTINGSFTILYRKEQFVKSRIESIAEGGPDIVLRIYGTDGTLLHTTTKRSGAQLFEQYHIQLDA